MERQDSMGAKLERPYCLTLLAEALLPTAPEESLSLCMQAVEIAGATHAHDFRPETRRIRAEALCALGRSGECAAEFEAGLMEARRDGSVLLEQRLLRSYSRCRSAPVVVRREALSLPPPPATALAVSRRCPSSEN